MRDEKCESWNAIWPPRQSHFSLPAHALQVVNAFKLYSQLSSSTLNMKELKTCSGNRKTADAIHTASAVLH